MRELPGLGAVLLPVGGGRGGAWLFRRSGCPGGGHAERQPGRAPARALGARGPLGEGAVHRPGRARRFGVKHRGTLADAVPCAPSSVSRQPSRLEAEVGVQLLEPVGRRVRPTEQAGITPRPRPGRTAVGRAPAAATRGPGLSPVSSPSYGAAAAGITSSARARAATPSLTPSPRGCAALRGCDVSRTDVRAESASGKICYPGPTGRSPMQRTATSGVEDEEACHEYRAHEGVGGTGDRCAER